LAPRISSALLALALASCGPDRIDKRANFLVEYYRSEAFGHTSSRRALYHLSGSRRTKVTDAAISWKIAAYDPDRIIYDTCDSGSGTSRYGPQSNCRHVYFDGHTRSSHDIGRGLKVSMSALDDSDRWCWNGRYVAIGDQYELVIVNLQNGTSTRLVEALKLEEPDYPQKWQHREVRWGRWSPDGEHGALIVMAPHGPGLPVSEWDEELYALDAATGNLTLVATHTGELGGQGERRLWRGDDFRWDGTNLLPPR
jgi:hypothetical protein